MQHYYVVIGNVWTLFCRHQKSEKLKTSHKYEAYKLFNISDGTQSSISAPTTYLKKIQFRSTKYCATVPVTKCEHERFPCNKKLNAVRNI